MMNTQPRRLSMISQLVLSALLLTASSPYAAEIEAASVCVAAYTVPHMRDIRKVPGVLTSCYEVAMEAVRQGVPTEFVVATGYVETRFRPHLIGSGGELGTLQVKPKWWPNVKQDPIYAGVAALRWCRDYGRHAGLKGCRQMTSADGRRLCRNQVLARDGWVRAMGHYKGGVIPDMASAGRRDRLARALERRRRGRRRPRG